MEPLNQFLREQKILQIAPHAGDPWIANVLMVCKDAEQLYFVGNKNTKYGQQLAEDPRLAFATAWHAEDNHLDRKGIQGVGEAVAVNDGDDVDTAVLLHNTDYPEFRDHITADWIKDNEAGACVWMITPSYIKFWNDELYGADGTKEFTF